MADRIPNSIRRARLLYLACAILVIQVCLTYGLARTEYLPSPPPLQTFASTLGAWTESQDYPIEPAALEMLGPDDVLNREYSRGSAQSRIGLFVAYYKSQLRARNAHDPKVCLPGSGWNAEISQTVSIPVAVLPEPLQVNYYVISRGQDRAVVLYWFQTHKRVFAKEQGLKAYRLWDTITDNRTDMALVRIVSPFQGDALKHATDDAVAFAQLLYPNLRSLFPSKD